MIYTNDIIKEKMNNKEKITKLLKMIILPIFAIIIILMAYLLYFKCIKHENNVDIFGFKQYIVATGSMEPTYKVGDLVIIKEKKQNDIKVNDVITYSWNKGKDTVTHRVTDIYEESGQTWYKTKGDNNNAEDIKAITYDQIQGVVVFKISKLGTILTSLISGTSLIFIFIVVIISYLHSCRKEERRIAREDARRLYNIPKYEKEDAV